MRLRVIAMDLQYSRCTRVTMSAFENVIRAVRSIRKCCVPNSYFRLSDFSCGTGYSTRQRLQKYYGRMWHIIVVIFAPLFHSLCHYIPALCANSDNQCTRKITFTAVFHVTYMYRLIAWELPFCRKSGCSQNSEFPTWKYDFRRLQWNGMSYWETRKYEFPSQRNAA